jgi:hypothetical protein
MGQRSRNSHSRQRQVVWRDIPASDQGNGNYTIRNWAKDAANGSIKAAELLLDLHRNSKTHGDYQHKPTSIQAWEAPGYDDTIHKGMTAMEAAAAYERAFPYRG